ncbi:MAG: hypothetical protein FHK80_00460 [Azoarcus sp. PHD]|nr:MAG: hypothetical protein FHK80_00460 [Azoarcus sp. PHD]
MTTATQELELPHVCINYTAEDGTQRTLSTDPDCIGYPVQLMLIAWILAAAPPNTTIQFNDGTKNTVADFDAECLLTGHLESLAPGLAAALPRVLRFDTPLPDGGVPYGFDAAKLASLPAAVIIEEVLKHVPPRQALEICRAFKVGLQESAEHRT